MEDKNSSAKYDGYNSKTLGNNYDHISQKVKDKITDNGGVMDVKAEKNGGQELKGVRAVFNSKESRDDFNAEIDKMKKQQKNTNKQSDKKETNNMTEYLPEGLLINTAENRAAMSSAASLKDAAVRETVLEARVRLCDREHRLHVDLGGIRGVIPKNEGALGIEEGKVKDIAVISRVGRPVCFVVTAIKRDEEGKLYAELSRRMAQKKCVSEYIESLVPGDVIGARVSHIDSFGVFCDIGCGVNALLPIDAVSVSRIPDPSVRFHNGQMIKAVVKSVDEYRRVTLTHKELLGTWSENAARFHTGETVPGIIRSVESYGVFVELTPNLAGLAEYDETVREGDTAAVYIKNIIPERMKIKLVIVDHSEEKQREPHEPVYFFNGTHMDAFRYSPEGSLRTVETVFG